MRLLLRNEQNKIYQELVEIIKCIMKLEDDEFYDSFQAVERIAILVGGLEMKNTFTGKAERELLFKIREESKK